MPELQAERADLRPTNHNAQRVIRGACDGGCPRCVVDARRLA